MKHILWLLAVCLSGCAQYAQVQMNLIDQTHKGVAICQKSQQAYAQVIDRLNDVQRTRLDEAFDADVRAQATLSPDWIIQHRKAYAAALDILAKSHEQLQQISETDVRNLAAIDAALQRLSWLDSIESKLFSFSGENP